jgi:hypothetical protein
MGLIGEATDQEARERRLRELISLAAATGAAIFEPGGFHRQAGCDCAPSATEAVEASADKVSCLFSRPRPRRR